MGKNSLIIFDVDGTLVNSNSGVVNSLKDMFYTIFNREIAEEELLKKQNDALERIISYFTHCEDNELIAKARLFYKQVYSEKYFKDISLFPKVKETISEFTSRFYLSTATNLSTEHLELIFDRLGIKHYFDYLRGTNLGDRPKPNPDIIYDSLKRFSIEKPNAVIIGDSLNDINAGKNAGITTILIDHLQRYHDHEKQQADYFANDCTSLQSIVKELFK